MSTTNAFAKPSVAQLEWHAMEQQMFVHMDPFWIRSETTPALENWSPDRFDADEWVDVAESFGAKQLLLVAKHASGFCLWPTQTTEFCIRNSPWRDGKGDIVGDVADACHRRGIKLGIYLSPQAKEMGVGCSGRAATEEKQEEYNQIFRTQLTELLTNYGTISEVWFDGSLVVEVGDILEKYAPDTIVFQGKHANIRWPGTESGILPYPAWNAVRQKDAQTGIATAVHGTPDGDVWMPLEADTPIRDHEWFWTEGGEAKLKSLEHLVNTYYQSTGHGGVLLLNANPDWTGKIPEADRKRFAEFGEEIRRRFASSIADTSGQGNEVILSFDKTELIDHVILMEDIAEGERIRKYILEGLHEEEWIPLAEGSAIGYKKIDFFPEVSVTSLRLRVVESAAEPRIRSMAAYHVGEIPSFERNAVRISNPMQAGQWEISEDMSDWSDEVDLNNACRMPGRYEIEIFSETSGAPVEVEEMTFLLEGLPGAEEFLVPMSSRMVWDLTVTAYEVDKKLSLTLKKNGSGVASGAVIVRPS